MTPQQQSQKLVRDLTARIAEKDPSVKIDLVQSVIDRMQGGYTVRITTDSSGVDDYSVWQDNGEWRFIRVMG